MFHQQEPDVHYSQPQYLHCPLCGAAGAKILEVGYFKEEGDGSLDFYKVTERQGVLAHKLPDHAGRLKGRSVVISMQGGSCVHLWNVVYRNQDTNTFVTEQSVLVQQQPQAQVLAEISFSVPPEATLAFNQNVWKRVLEHVRTDQPLVHQYIEVAKPRGFNAGVYWLEYQASHAKLAEVMALKENRAIIEAAVARVMCLPAVTVSILVDGHVLT